ncbi:hypothetical protein ABNQ39_18585 [Azospirillum sp. A26]|uniref:hypothetical protein n=1 Tax=Azospirillum sp. A26 TaxID=3160607 RepID=UPI00366B5B28
MVLKINHASFTLALLVSCAFSMAAKAEGGSCPTTVTVSSTFPTPCINGKTGGAELAPTAAYAWEAFIALNWPAATGSRGKPDPAKSFGDLSGPTAWETMRAKVELYPGNGSASQAPHGVVLDAGNKPTNGPDYGYEQSPAYYYDPVTTGTKDGLLPACSGQVPTAVPAFVPLDETSQIGNNQTYAGTLSDKDPKGFNKSPQLIRYAVKMNLPVFQNIVSNKYWWNSTGAATPLNNALGNAITAIENRSKTGENKQPDDPYVNFVPANAEQVGPGVFVKSAWRPLTNNEVTSGRFRTAPVRYYEKNDQGNPCYREDVWGLVGMHVITFPPNAPWVIWSTFEQADNILTSDGKPTEDPNGKPLGQMPAAATTPQLTSDPQQLNPVVKALGPYCDNPGQRLFFRENPQRTALPSGGNICLDRRWHALSDEIVAANETAHAAMMSAGKDAAGVWQYYKLINVQPVPVDGASMNLPNVSTTASFYLANAVLETDYSLANFTGNLVNGAPSNVVAGPKGTLVEYYNTQLFPFEGGNLGFLSKPMQMGGCAGCHGFANNTGRNFSFSLGRNVKTPDPTDAFSVQPALLSNFNQ